MLELKVYKGERLRQTIPISHRAYVLGRSINSDIVLPDHRVSRKHCTIYFDPDGGEFQIGDLNSKIGTFLNGTRLTRPERLRVGDVISFGARSEFVLKFERHTSEVLPPEREEDSEKQQKHAITSTINIRKVVRDSEHQIVRQRMVGDKSPGASAGLHAREVPQHFYDLSCRLALTTHHQQVYEALAEHVFATTPADRLMVLRLRPSPPPRDDESDRTVVQRGYSVEFCEFSQRTAEAAKSIGTLFSRSVVRRSVEEQKGLLFTQPSDKSASQAQIRATSSICAPIPGRSEVLGVLYLDVLQGSSENFSGKHLELASMYAYLFGLYAERQRAIDDRREAERLASAGLAVFGAAHYLKNVLTGLQGSRSVIDMLMKSGDTARVGETWGVMTRSLDAIGSTIKRMLDYARSAHLEIQPIDAGMLMSEVCEGYADLCRDRGIALVVEQHGPPFTAEGDAACLEDVLRNLISNAIDCFRYDHREEAPPARIVARTIHRLAPRELVWEVEDNGPGIPEDVQPRLFTLFFSTKGAGGSGLGLALCQKYVVGHGGRLDYATSPAGTTFRAVLPQRAGFAPDHPTMDSR